MTRFLLRVRVSIKAGERERKRGFVRFCLSFFDGRDPNDDDDDDDDDSRCD